MSAAGLSEHCAKVKCDIRSGRCDGQGPHMGCPGMAELRQKKAALDAMTAFASLQITAVAEELDERLARLPEMKDKLAAAKENLEDKLDELNEHAEAGGCISPSVYQLAMDRYIEAHRAEQLPPTELNSRAAAAAMFTAKRAARPDNCNFTGCVHKAAVDHARSRIGEIKDILAYMRTPEYNEYTKGLQVFLEENIEEFHRRLAAL